MINLIAPINDLGYGVVSKNIFRELYKRQPLLNLYPLGPVQLNSDQAKAYSNGKILRRDFSDLRIWHQNDLGYFISNYFKSALTFFELTRLTKQEISHLNSLDLLYLPSHWHEEIASQNSVSTKVQVLPMAVDTSIFTDISAPYQKFLGIDQNGTHFDKPLENQPTVFMTCGKWEIRKGHDIIIECFEKAFDKYENVKLIANCHNPFIKNNEDWQQRYGVRMDQVDIIYDRLPTQEHLARIFQMVDCGIFPARAEGFNMEAAELLAMGKQCIMTNYSGHTEYAEKAGASLINIEKLEPAHDGVFFNCYNQDWEGSPGMWAEISSNQIDEIVDKMRKVHKYKSENGFIPKNNKGVEHFQNWTWGKVAEQIIKDTDES